MPGKHKQGLWYGFGNATKVENDEKDSSSLNPNAYAYAYTYVFFLTFFVIMDKIVRFFLAIAIFDATISF